MSDSDRPPLPTTRLTRRALLEASAAGAALAIVPGCGEAPPERIVPYVERPPEHTPGVSRFYATAGLRAGVAIGVLGESREGRPIKIEGNPEHPFSLGATGPIEQALPYTLYDSGRLASVAHRGLPSTFDAFARAISERAFQRRSGEGLHVWLEPTTSPGVEALLDQLAERLPGARVWFDPSLAPIRAWEGTRRVFGRPLTPQYLFERADRVLALDADFLTQGPGAVRWAHDWALRRRPDGEAAMSRCYAVDAAPTGTSISFDHRAITRSSQIGAVAAGLLAALGVADRSALDRAPHASWIEAVARDLASHRRRSVVVCGDRQPAHVHALVWSINAVLESLGETIVLTAPPWRGAGGPAFQPAPLMHALEAGDVETLLVLGGNPAYTASGTMQWGARARRAGEILALSQYPHETARLADWVIPERHLLERWGDGRAHDGTWTTIQPLVRPLFGGHDVDEVLLALLGEPRRTAGDALRRALETAGHEPDRVLARGFVEGSASPIEHVEPSLAALGPALAELAPAVDGFELDLRLDARLEDGAHAENAWLEELPELTTKLVWDNAALLAEEDAAALGLVRGDVVEIRAGDAAVRLPALPTCGQARRTIVAWLGFGRAAGGHAGRGVGVDVAALRSGSDEWWIDGVRLRATGERRELATTQHEFEPPPEEVAVVLRRTLREYQRHPSFPRHRREEAPSLHPDRLSGSPQWGMAIDLDLCVGCQACVIACQVENNVPVVGRAQVGLGREMHWLRIDRYAHRPRACGELRMTLQPMLCQHCEKAPCEYVCPVNATTHSPDGLNEMTYNRCVGTRFCSNNCPYKVRRFNYYDWHSDAGEPEIMAFNPDVSVRGRGVMEKCTYCVQRIRAAQIRARVAGRELADGDVVTACQQACATRAIVFGDVEDPRSQVSRWHASPRTYAVLDDLGTRPRTRYLARIDNTNEELEGG